MIGRTFLTAAVSNISLPMFSINTSKRLMFVSLALYKDVYLACHAGGDELLILFILSLGLMDVD